MGRLNFKDIGDWTPSAISIVDQPDHPLAVFEVYENDEEFVKKSINVDDIMVEEIKSNDEQMVSGPVSFFKELFNRPVVTKSAEQSNEPPAKEDEVSDMDKIMAKLEAMDKKIDGIEKDVNELKGEEPPKENNEEDPAPGTVTKQEGNTGDNDTTSPEGGDVVDDNNVVTKSRQVDPDEVLTV